MELTNTTPVPADAFVVAEDDTRTTVITAKVTVDFDGELETQSPLPLLAVDEPTELGLLPADAYARFDDAFEVIVLARAHAPPGRSVARRHVSMSVGDQTRHLQVSGDRTWQRGKMTEPVPFTAMAMTYARAFGGRCDVYLDAQSPLSVSHPLNALGRGFDPAPVALALREQLRLPDGLPYVDYERRLPNVEDPEHLIAHPDDDAVPASWATVPIDIGLSMLRVHQRRIAANAAAGYRAHPDWIVSRPAAGARIRLSGLSPRGRDDLEVPQFRVFFDCGLARCELAPQRLVLLPEQRRMHLLYRARLPCAVKAARVRLEPGWCAPTLSASGSSS